MVMSLKFARQIYYLTKKITHDFYHRTGALHLLKTSAGLSAELFIFATW